MNQSNLDIAMRLQKVKSLIKSMEELQGKVQHEVLVMDWLLAAQSEV